MSRIELYYEIYKINDFALAISGAADFITCSPLLCI